MKKFKINEKKVSRVFGSVAKMAKFYNIKQSTLEHLIYKRKTLTFKSEEVREITNKLIDNGFILYADDL
ncbi:hypothetical protein [Helicobacter anatolicus]|uniref:hypothetical protein n=1 Tax=Helicobacter anatolicus TaxID=2905874 RepID=UPI001E3758A4|nr:hypothetical protein [Helicobacter anatolicus]MCE3040270.1 hypothetical protein [Helicobacter anatolicus]